MNDTIKEGRELTDEDRRLYEWIDVTTYEDRANGKTYYIRGLAIKENPFTQEL